MRYSFLTLLLSTLMAGAAVAQAGNNKPIQLKNNADSLGYAIGADIGRNLKKQGYEVNLEAVHRGMQDAFNEKTTQLSEEQARTVMANYQRVLREKQDKLKATQATDNLKKGEEFLAQNKAKPGVVTLDNGLQYQVLKEGTGRQPTLTDKVTTHYHGTLLDGTVFDSSVERGQPATFPVNGVIQAWQTMLPLMKEGGKVRIWAHPNLAYGAQGAGGKIGPNATLVFEIELIKVE